MLSTNEILGNDYVWLPAFIVIQQRDTPLACERREGGALSARWEEWWALAYVDIHVLSTDMPICHYALIYISCYILLLQYTACVKPSHCNELLSCTWIPDFTIFSESSNKRIYLSENNSFSHFTIFYICHSQSFLHNEYFCLWLWTMKPEHKMNNIQMRNAENILPFGITSPTH